MSFFLSIFFLSLVVVVMIIGFGSEIGIVVYPMTNSAKTPTSISGR